MKPINELDHNLIYGYLKGEISEEEKALVLQRIESDTEFAANVTWYKNLFQEYDKLHTTKQEETHLINELRQINQRLKAKEKAVESNFTTEYTFKRADERKFGTLAWLFGISIALLGIVYLIWPKGHDEHRIGDNTTIDSTAITINSRDSVKIQERALAYLSDQPKVLNPPASIEPAIKAYQNDDPSKALRLLANIKVPSHPVIIPPVADSSGKPRYGAGTDSVKSPGIEPAEVKRILAYQQFYKGLVYIEQGRFSDASTIFNEVKDPLRRQAEWYQAICLLQLKQIDKGKAILQRIDKESNHPYHTEAQELLKQF